MYKYEYIYQLMNKHSKLCDYQNSLIKTHDRITKIANKNPFVYFSCVKIGRRIIQKSRKTLDEATKIYNEVLLLIRKTNDQTRNA